MSITLHGYKYSVYSWIARFALAEKGVEFTWQEIDPFGHDVPDDYLELNPFQRVPTLAHDGFILYETGAITRYVDDAFPGIRLQPDGAQDRARMAQIISIIDSDAYWPMVRQVFAHGVLGPVVDRHSDPAQVEAGLAVSPRILGALERLAIGGPFLVGDQLTLTDIHLAPMMAYFVLSPDARVLLQNQPRLTAWWETVSARAAFLATLPRLPAGIKLPQGSTPDTML